MLREISFSVDAGEAVAIIGQNGAGKSTLLKLITGTTLPTTGVIESGGRIAAILELGMGFNPDLSGRENVRHAAGLMGYPHAQIEAAMPSIEEFAEIGEYFDHPIRTYSSGMQMRVAFAVVTAWRPNLLIVDEALSVGDSYFQHKSFNRIREFQKQGTTLLLVSHDRGSILALCDRVVLLDKGSIVMDGRPDEVMDFYNAMIADKENSTVQVRQLDDGYVETRSGTGEATIESVSLFDESGRPAEYVAVGSKVSLKVTLLVNQDIPELVVGYAIKNRLGQDIFGTNTFLMDCKLGELSAGQRVEYDFIFPMMLGVGSYSVSVALHTDDTHVLRNYEWRDRVLVFNVVNLSHEPFTGVAWMPPKVECKL